MRVTAADNAGCNRACMSGQGLCFSWSEMGSCVRFTLASVLLWDCRGWGWKQGDHGEATAIVQVRGVGSLDLC